MDTSLGTLKSGTDGLPSLAGWSRSSAPPPPVFASTAGRHGAPLARTTAEPWHAAWAEAGFKRAEPEEFRLGLVYLKSWPAIPDLPQEMAAPVARVCALLAHKPTVGFLVGRVLELPDEEARRILQVLHRFGHLEVLQRRGVPGAEGAVEPPPAGEAAIAVAPPAPSAFLGRLWNKLVSR